MRRKGRRADALEHSHEDTCDSRDYGFHDAAGKYWLGRSGKSLHRPPGVWRWDHDGDLVTCPHCLAMMKEDDDDE